MIAYFKKIADMALAKIFKVSKVYPVLAGPTLVAKDSGAWAVHGTPTQIIAKDIITSAFVIDYVNTTSISAVGSYELVLYTGLAGFEVEIARIPLERTANASQEGAIPVNTESIAANTRISATLSGSPVGLESVSIKIRYSLS